MTNRVTLGSILAKADPGVWGAEDNETGYSVLRSTNFSDEGNIDFEKLSFRAIPDKKIPEKLLKPGDILLERSGGGPKKPVGRVCFFKGHRIAHSFGNFIARLRVETSAVEPKYVHWYLWHFHRVGKTTHYQKQTTGIRNLEFRRYLEIEIPLPPLPEQRRIVDILNHADSIRRLRRQAEQKAREIIPALFVEMFGDPVTNPRGWTTAPLRNLAYIESTVTVPSMETEHLLPCIGPDAIESQTGKLLEITTVGIVQPKSGKYWFDPTDVIYSKIRPYLAKAVLPGFSGYISADMYPLKCKDSLTPQYLWALLLTKSFTDFAIKESTRAQMPKLNRTTLFSFCAPVPPIETQKCFVERVTETQALITQQSRMAETAETTMQALMARYFNY